MDTNREKQRGGNGENYYTISGKEIIVQARGKEILNAFEILFC